MIRNSDWEIFWKAIRDCQTVTLQRIFIFFYLAKPIFFKPLSNCKAELRNSNFSSNCMLVSLFLVTDKQARHRAATLQESLPKMTSLVLSRKEDKRNEKSRKEPKKTNFAKSCFLYILCCRRPTSLFECTRNFRAMFFN